MSKNQCFLFVDNFAYFFFFLLETCIFKKIYLNKFKLHHVYMYLYLCVWINLISNSIKKAKNTKIKRVFKTNAYWKTLIIFFFHWSKILVNSSKLIHYIAQNKYYKLIKKNNLYICTFTLNIKLFDQKTFLYELSTF